ncbi:hypothetical protein ACNTMW_32540 [Planosporangium sp. 12N6]|uniref:hypothetical protein n=1 Tax=Planosporangium spinosum TaxID=3402278 RepID=UPI003CF14D14
MGRDRTPGVDRGTAESLLHGDRCPGAPEPLVHLLAAATAPGGRSELAGEEAAVAAFRQSHRPPVHAPGRRALLAGVLTVKLTAAFTLTAVGGAALAAGGLHRLHGTSRFGARPAAPVATTPAPATTGRVTVVPTAPAPSRSAQRPAVATSAPPVDNLCRILIADLRNRTAGTHVGLDGSAFASLVAAAGSYAGVWSYCSRLLTPAMPVPTPAAEWWTPQRTRSGYPSPDSGGPTPPGSPPQYPDPHRYGQHSMAASPTTDRDSPRARSVRASYPPG